MLLTGTFVRVLDEKLRVSLPKAFRPTSSRKSVVWFVAPGTDGSLDVYSRETFTALSRRLAAAPPNEQNVRDFRRLFFAQAERVELDRQGRLRIPVRLAELARLNKEVVLLGIQDHIELWDQRRWKRYLKKKTADYDSIAESAFDRQS